MRHVHAQASDAPAVLAWLRQHVPGAAHLCLDSRGVRSGDVFFACAATQADRQRHIAQALRAGAVAVVAQGNAPDDDSPALPAVPLLSVAGLTSLLGAIAHAWYDEPSATLTVMAVTGTNGKTSTVQWLAAALNAGSVPCGAIGTLGVTLPDGKNLDKLDKLNKFDKLNTVNLAVADPATTGVLTTPDVLSMHRTLALLRDAGAAAVAIEASSIGLAQGRLDGVQIAFAGFTNLTHDHLDYHHDMAQYRAAKFSLFARAGLRGAVVNLDDAAGADLFARLPAEIRVGYTCGAHPDAAVAASDIQVGAHGQVCQLRLPDGAAQLVTAIAGEHNVCNLLLVAGMLHLMGWPLPRVAQALAALRPVDGRLEIVSPPAACAAPVVVVDYAHTPDALAHALQTLRRSAQAARGKLVCVFGCGGNRDAAKRPLMGQLASALADRVIVTSDNPRLEAPQAIAAQIVQGLNPAPRVILERAQAIVLAILDAAPGDVVLLAGKGHETWQEIEGQRQPFDDRVWAALALALRTASGVSTDTRTLQAGALFAALRGERFDGHEYLAQAAQAGAIGALVAHPIPHIPDIPQFCVGDTHAALGHLAAAWRSHHPVPLIAVTGSNGKTTTKEMLAAILRSHFGEQAVLATRGNLNNAIGVPLTLLRLRTQHRVAVAELGMNHPGEIAGLAAMAQPDVALVNNAQREHQEFLGTVQATARENGAVLSALPADGVAVYPGLDACVPVWDALAPGRARLRCGIVDAAENTSTNIVVDGVTLDVFASAVALHDDGTVFCLHLPARAEASGETGDAVNVVDVALVTPGLHNVHNALAAAACAHAVGVPVRTIARGLADFHPVSGRMRVTPYRGMGLIDDSYNANPDSVRAAIDALARRAGARTLVLGDMGEVGADSCAAHAEMGSYARARGINTLLTLGDACTHAVAAFGAGARGCASVQEIVDAIVGSPPAHVLVKGSRFMRMERVVAQLQAGQAQQQTQPQAQGN